MRAARAAKTTCRFRALAERRKWRKWRHSRSRPTAASNAQPEKARGEHDFFVGPEFKSCSMAVSDHDSVSYRTGPSTVFYLLVSSDRKLAESLSQCSLSI